MSARRLRLEDLRIDEPVLEDLRCATCHALGHDAAAHSDVRAAARVTDELIARGKTLEARAWLRVVLKLAQGPNAGR